MTDKHLLEMDYQQLVSLKDEVDKALLARKSREKQQAQQEVLAFIDNHGFSFDELFPDCANQRKRRPAKPKYRNPANFDQTWTGRGKRPGWIQNLMDQGRDKAEFLID